MPAMIRYLVTRTQMVMIEAEEDDEQEVLRRAESRFLNLTPGYSTGNEKVVTRSTTIERA